MRLTRRRFFGAAAAAFWASGAVPVLAARYLDETGLKNQSFIWQPTFAPSGPVTIVVSLAEEILHVFRGERLLGIARCVPARAQHNIPVGVFRIDAASSLQRGPLAWQGRSLHAFNVDQTDPAFLSGALSCITISPAFAELLTHTVGAGALVIMAPERTPITRVRSFAPLVLRSDAITDSREDEYNTAAFIFTRGAFGTDETQSPKPQPLSIVVSSTDKRARIVSSGQPTHVVGVNIAQSDRPLGAHAYSLTTPKMGRSPATWIATGLSAKGDAPHIKNEIAQQSLDRLSFVDPEIAADVANALSPGASIVLSDAPLDDRDNASSIRPVLISAGTQDPSVAQTQVESPPLPEQKTAITKKRPAARSSKQVARNSNKLGADTKTRSIKSKRISKKRTAIKPARPSNEPLIGPKNFQDP